MFVYHFSPFSFYLHFLLFLFTVFYLLFFCCYCRLAVRLTCFEFRRSKCVSSSADFPRRMWTSFDFPFQVNNFETNGVSLDDIVYDHCLQGKFVNGQRSTDYNVYSTFQSHEPEFDYLKSLEIEEKINQIKWLKRKNAANFILSTNGWRSSVPPLNASLSMSFPLSLMIALGWGSCTKVLVPIVSLIFRTASTARSNRDLCTLNDYIGESCAVLCPFYCISAVQRNVFRSGVFLYAMRTCVFPHRFFSCYKMENIQRCFHICIFNE